MELCDLAAHQLAKLLRQRKVSAEEVCRSVLQRIDEIEEKTKAYITLDGENALEQARRVDRRLKEGADLPPLAGIPVAVKDNICTRGLRTTCASKILANLFHRITQRSSKNLPRWMP